MQATEYDVLSARSAIAGIAVETPLLSSPRLSERVGAAVALKPENLQVTGSFKVRGAANKMLALSEEEKSRGVVACSSGNHGRAVAYVAELLGIPATVCVPEWVDPLKLAAIRRHGAETLLAGTSYDEAQERSIEIAEERRLAYVHPFDDAQVIAGQGTIGLELLEQLPSLDAVVVPLSGGGLIAGIAIAVKSQRPGIRVIAVSAANARVMYESQKAGRPIEFPEEETIANALSGGIGDDNRHTFPLVRDYVDEHVLVTEEEIEAAMVFAVREQKLVVEGGGAVAIAALLSGKVERPGDAVAAVLSGGNINSRALRSVIAKHGADGS